MTLLEAQQDTGTPAAAWRKGLCPSAAWSCGPLALSLTVLGITIAPFPADVSPQRHDTPPPRLGNTKGIFRERKG